MRGEAENSVPLGSAHPGQASQSSSINHLFHIQNWNDHNVAFGDTPFHALYTTLLQETDEEREMNEYFNFNEAALDPTGQGVQTSGLVVEEPDVQIVPDEDMTVVLGQVEELPDFVHSGIPDLGLSNLFEDVDTPNAMPTWSTTTPRDSELTPDGSVRFPPHH